MKRTVRALALMTTLGAFLATTLAISAVAQEKKAPAKTGGANTGIVEVNEGKDGKFRFVVRDNDSKYLVSSAAFATKDDAMKGIERLKEVLENPKFTSKK